MHIGIMYDSHVETDVLLEFKKNSRAQVKNFY